MTYTPTPAETTAYADMQARLIALLLRHDASNFGRFFGQRSDFEAATPSDVLRPYRELGVLFHLRDELFEDLLPRIVRRLSFESPRALVVEEPPAGGRVDWARTFDVTWTERPGEPPLQLHTRQRRRDFATPENMLVVVTLLEYRRDVERVLWDEQIAVGAAALRHPLNEIVDRCDRELAFPQFAGLRQRAQQVIDGADGGPESLELRVYDRLMPGSNSAYEELLQWRKRLHTLSLLQRHPDSATDVLGADPRRDNYLYQYWIFYELADYLADHRRLVSIDSRRGSMCLQFRWGTESENIYELRHDQAVPQPIVRWHTVNSDKRVPGVRPDFYLHRVEPAVYRVQDGDNLYWHEPGVLWDAKYYRERASDDAPSPPIKRMLADLTLLGEPYGVLLFALLADDTIAADDTGAGTAGDESSELDIGSYKLTAKTPFDQTLGASPVVLNVPLRPASIPTKVRRILASLLNQMHDRLGTPKVPHCYGVFLDTLSAAHRIDLVDRYGQALGDDVDELLICPKPHIGAWRNDLVNRVQHCCQDGTYCHILGQKDATKPIRPPRTAADLLKELQQVFRGTTPLDEEAVTVIARQVEGLTRRFAEIAGVYRQIEVYYHRLRDLGLSETLDLLKQPERESLALAIFLVDQLDSIGAHDYSAPAIHLSSVMEIEVKRRIFTCPNLRGDLAKSKSQTLGKLPFIERCSRQDDCFHKVESKYNWDAIQEFVAAHWDGHVDSGDPDRVIAFEMFVTKALNRIAQIRNTAAHTDVVSRKEYTDLQKIVFQGGSLGYSALNALLLAWKPSLEGLT